MYRRTELEKRKKERKEYRAERGRGFASRSRPAHALKPVDCGSFTSRQTYRAVRQVPDKTTGTGKRRPVPSPAVIYERAFRALEFEKPEVLDEGESSLEFF